MYTMRHPDSTNTPEFQGLDRSAPIDVGTRNLPHWSQAGATLFITFRTRDSMPRAMIARWEATLEDWLARQGQNPTLAAEIVRGPPALSGAALRSLPHWQQQSFHRVKHRLWQRGLDDGHGACLLRQPRLAQIVARTLLYFQDVRYMLDSFVVMPNHVHVLMQSRPEASPRQVTGGWMRYSARQINATVGRRGGFWQPEAFDHIVRSEGQFNHLRRYIRVNPREARLGDGQFLYWSRGPTPDDQSVPTGIEPQRRAKPK